MGPLDSTNFLTINGQAVTGTVNNISELVSLINTQVSGVVASASGDKLVLTASDGRNISVAAADHGNDNDAADAIFGQSAAIGNLGSEVVIARGGLTLYGDSSFTTGTTVGDEMTGEGNSTATNTYVNSLSITTVANANESIRVIDLALQDIDTIRGDLGAVQNRFESTIANLQNVSENLSAARSRILDADIAQETSAMTKNNILQQAGVSILAQANQMPQLALSLLG